jgi:hypothetical protein
MGRFNEPPLFFYTHCYTFKLQLCILWTICTVIVLVVSLLSSVEVFRRKLLFKLADITTVDIDVAYIVADNFNKLLSDVQREITFQACRKR